MAANHNGVDRQPSASLREFQNFLDQNAFEQAAQTTSWKKYARLVLPHVGLVTVVCVYAMIGAWVFYSLESPHEDSLKAKGIERIASMRRELIDVIWQRRRADERGDAFASHAEWTTHIRHKLQLFNENLYRAYKEQYVRYGDVKITSPRAVDMHQKGQLDARITRHHSSGRWEKGGKLWTASSSLFFATTTMATIGYGNIVPVTSKGRIACIVFALFGAPLAIITIGDLGKFLSECTIWLYRCMKERAKIIRYQLKMWSLRKRSLVRDVDVESLRNVSDGGTLSDAGGDGDAARSATTNTVMSDWDELDKAEVPVFLVFAILLLYIAFGGVLFAILESWTYMDAFYYCFVSLTTIGFGDLVPNRHEYIAVMLAYLGVGLAVTTMCIDLVGIQYIQKIHYFGRKFKGTDILQILRRKRMLERRFAMGEGKEFIEYVIHVAHENKAYHPPVNPKKLLPALKMASQFYAPELLEQAMVSSGTKIHHAAYDTPPLLWSVENDVGVNALAICAPAIAQRVRTPSLHIAHALPSPPSSTPSDFDPMGSDRTLLYDRWSGSRPISWAESGPSPQACCSLSTEASVYLRELLYGEGARSPALTVLDFPMPSPDLQLIAEECRRSRRVLSCPSAIASTGDKRPAGGHSSDSSSASSLATISSTVRWNAELRTVSSLSSSDRLTGQVASQTPQPNVITHTGSSHRATYAPNEGSNDAEEHSAVDDDDDDDERGSLLRAHFVPQSSESSATVATASDSTPEDLARNLSRDSHAFFRSMFLEPTGRDPMGLFCMEAWDSYERMLTEWINNNNRNQPRDNLPPYRELKKDENELKMTPFTVSETLETVDSGALADALTVGALDMVTERQGAPEELEDIEEESDEAVEEPDEEDLADLMDLGDFEAEQMSMRPLFNIIETIFEQNEDEEYLRIEEEQEEEDELENRTNDAENHEKPRQIRLSSLKYPHEAADAGPEASYVALLPESAVDVLEAVATHASASSSRRASAAGVALVVAQTTRVGDARADAVRVDAPPRVKLPPPRIEIYPTTADDDDDDYSSVFSLSPSKNSEENATASRGARDGTDDDDDNDDDDESPSADESAAPFDIDLGAFELVDSGVTAEALLRHEEPVIYHRDMPVHSVHHDTVQTEAAIENVMSAPASMLINAIPPTMVADNYCFVVDGDKIDMADIMGDDQWWRHTSRPTKYFYSEDLKRFYRVNCLTVRGGRIISARLANTTPSMGGSGASVVSATASQAMTTAVNTAINAAIGAANNDVAGGGAAEATGGGTSALGSLLKSRFPSLSSAKNSNVVPPSENRRPSITSMTTSGIKRASAALFAAASSAFKGHDARQLAVKAARGSASAAAAAASTSSGGVFASTSPGSNHPSSALPSAFHSYATTPRTSMSFYASGTASAPLPPTRCEVGQRGEKVDLAHVYKVIRFYSFWKTCTSFHRIVTTIEKVTDDGMAEELQPPDMLAAAAGISATQLPGSSASTTSGSSRPAPADDAMVKSESRTSFASSSAMSSGGVCIAPSFKKRLFVQYLWRNAKPSEKSRVQREFDPRRQRLLQFVTDPAARKRMTGAVSNWQRAAAAGGSRARTRTRTTSSGGVSDEQQASGC